MIRIKMLNNKNKKLHKLNNNKRRKKIQKSKN